MYLIDILNWYAATGNKLENLKHIDVFNNEKYQEVRFFKKDDASEIHPLVHLDVSDPPTKDISYTQAQITEAIKALAEDKSSGK